MGSQMLKEIENFVITLDCSLVEKYIIFEKLLKLYFQGKVDQIKETIKLKDLWKRK